MKWKTWAIAASAVAVTAVGIGYASAWMSLSSCEDSTYADIQRRNVFGRDLWGNKIVMLRSDLSAYVTGPFSVEVWYMVPRDLHGTRHRQQCQALPWRQRLGTRQDYPMI